MDNSLIKTLYKKNSLNLLYSNKVHIGHSIKDVDSSMFPLLGIERQGFWMINLDYSKILFKRSLNVLRSLFVNNKSIIFVGTKFNSQQTVKYIAGKTKQFYVNQKWIGGLLTNPSVMDRALNLNILFNKPGLELHTRRDILLYKRYKNLFQGICNLNTKPDLIFIFNVEDNLNIVKEAHQANIPVMAIVDTNINIKNISYPIPGNDDNIDSINLYSNLILEVFNSADKKSSNSIKKKQNEALLLSILNSEISNITSL